jgi:hypothetical protein
MEETRILQGEQLRRFVTDLSILFFYPGVPNGDLHYAEQEEEVRVLEVHGRSVHDGNHGRSVADLDLRARDEESVKEHFRKYRIAYISGGVVTFAGITWVIMRGRHAGVLSVPDGLETVTVRPLSFFSKQSVVTVIEREGRGHPGYLVQCKETGDIFLSQAEAARNAGTSAANMSSHLTGKFPDIYGLHYERIGV